MKALDFIKIQQWITALCVAPILVLSSNVYADEAASAGAESTVAAAPTPDWTYSFNLGLYSAYIFRGVQLTTGPALQGGFDIGHSSGLYAGTWLSNLDPYYYGKNDGLGTDGNNLEQDFYLGYAHTFENGLGVNVLGNYYKYWEGKKANNILPSNANRQHKQDSFEASLALSYQWFTYTYYRVLTDYYGLDQTDSNFTVTGDGNTDGADYHEFKVNYTLPGDLNLVAKVGYQKTPHLQGSEGDYMIGLNRNFSLPAGSNKSIDGFNAGAYFTNTFNVDNQAFYVSADGRDTNGKKLWFFVKRTW